MVESIGDEEVKKIQRASTFWHIEKGGIYQ